MTSPIAAVGAPDASTASIETHLVDPTAPTLLAFAGMGHGLQMPVAEFAGVLAPLRVNVLFVKDLQRCWYQHGLVGIGPDLARVAPVLAGLVPSGSRLAGTVGTSSGGTGAVLYGVELAAPVVLAFSPRTLIDAAAVDRWRTEVPDMPAIDLTAASADLRRALQARPDGADGRVEVHYGAGNAADAHQVARIADLPGVKVRAHPTDWHPSAAWLRDRGRLGRTLAEAFDLDLLPGADFADRPVLVDPPRRVWRPGPLWRAARARLTGLAAHD